MVETATETQGWPSRGRLYEPYLCRIDAVTNLTHAEKLFRVVRLDQRL